MIVYFDSKNCVYFHLNATISFTAPLVVELELLIAFKKRWIVVEVDGSLAELELQH
jgi:hypothetical protein